ncbi:hypothetical protein [Moorena sp. SIOASIH]|nr:hypothetical protein [Moorena sp. SIOASIH]
MGETPKTALHRLIKISPSPYLPTLSLIMGIQANLILLAVSTLIR